MKGILLLAHGSREKETELTFRRITEAVKKKVNNVVIETAYLQFSQINLEKGLNNLVTQNVDDISVIPYFLFSGVHIRETIPRTIEEYVMKNPNVKITIENTFGEDDRLANILADQVCEALE